MIRIFKSTYAWRVACWNTCTPAQLGRINQFFWAGRRGQHMEFSALERDLILSAPEVIWTS